MQYSLAWAVRRAEDAAERLSRSFRDVEVHTDDTRRFRVSAVESGDTAVVLTDMTWEGSGRARTGADDYVLVSDVHDGSLALVADGVPLDSTGPVLVRARTIETSWAATLRTRTVRFRRSAIDDYARDILGQALHAVTFSSTRPLSAAHEQLWRAAERFARTDVAGHSELLHNDVIWDATARQLIATVLAVFPNSTTEWTRATEPERALPGTVRRAIAYMEEHIAEPIGAADIAAAARLSPRGLQTAFRRELDSTPTEYLRRLRLEGAHRSAARRPHRRDDRRADRAPVGLHPRPPVRGGVPGRLRGEPGRDTPSLNPQPVEFRCKRADSSPCQVGSGDVRYARGRRRIRAIPLR